jgi:protein SERAC1
MIVILIIKLILSLDLSKYIVAIGCHFTMVYQEYKRQVSLRKVSGCDNSLRKADVVFVHGLDGHAFETWHHKCNSKRWMEDWDKDSWDPETADEKERFWLSWLGEDIPDIGVWSLDYPAPRFSDGEMDLSERSISILEYFYSKREYGIGKRPLYFVVHSLGGLLVKQMLCESRNISSKYHEVMENVEGIVFLATPHKGSELANFLGKLIGVSAIAKDLKRGKSGRKIGENGSSSKNLGELNNSYRKYFSSIKIHVFYEKKKTTLKKIFGIFPIRKMVVDRVSANPDIKDIKPVAADGDHLSICRLPSREYPIYDSVRNFIEDGLVQKKTQ